MTISTEITVKVCQNCAFWRDDEIAHKACDLTGIPCGQFHSCSKHQYIPGFALKIWAKNHKE